MISISEAIWRQYESRGRSLTSSPKGFSSSRPMATKLRMMYAATIHVSIAVVLIERERERA